MLLGYFLLCGIELMDYSGQHWDTCGTCNTECWLGEFNTTLPKLLWVYLKYKDNKTKGVTKDIFVLPRILLARILWIQNKNNYKNSSCPVCIVLFYVTMKMWSSSLEELKTISVSFQFEFLPCDLLHLEHVGSDRKNMIWKGLTQKYVFFNLRI